MELFIYAKSSHRDGLENVRRTAALCTLLEVCKPTLCTGDYRAASIARATMGVAKTMGIDAMGNLPHTMERLDMLIYDNEDVTQEMHEQMFSYCSRVYRIGDAIAMDIVDPEYFGTFDTKREKALFFGDDDYKKWFLDFCEGSQKYDFALVNGNYFFLDSGEILERSFCEIVDEEHYMQSIQETKYLLSASVQACLESLAAGNAPVYFQRGDKEAQNIELLQKYNIPIASGERLDALIENFENICTHYPKTQAIQMYDVSSLKEEILGVFEQYKDIPCAISYGY
ncbi:MAG: hypothetical protein PHH41_00585 [Sulfurimonas sp.]|nr:hypothetical protein [Sulfurimonas sp.]MDD5201616.1 hypothetical protein [Sulfurimonas sp.]